MRTLFTLALLLSATPAAANVVETFTLNTSSISGTFGSIDFGLYSGPGADQTAIALVSNFSTTGSYAGSQVLTGNAQGGPVIPGAPLLLVSTVQDSDDLETIHFGSTLRFTVTLSGPEVTAPDGKATSTDQFIFETYSDAAGTIPVLTSDPNGFSGELNISPAGVVTASAISPQITIAATPEPGSFSLLFGVLAIFAATFFTRRLRSSN